VPANTSRLALTYPQNSDAPNGASQIQLLATQLDGLVNGFYSGTAANRSSVVPSPSTGQFYLATDTGECTMYNGTAWVDIAPAITLLSLQAKGDLLVASGANAVARMAAGADYKTLRSRAAATNGLEYAFLYTVLQKSANYTLNPFEEAWFTTGSSTLIPMLPAPGNAGLRYKIGKADSGTGGLTVTTPSGLLLGVGLGAGATTAAVSAQGAVIEIVDDGTNYRIAGNADSGWAALTLGSNWSNVGSPYMAAAAHRIGDRVYLGGLIQSSGTGGTTAATLPSSMWPTTQKALATCTGGQVGAAIIVTTAGNLNPVPTGPTVAIQLDGLSYPLGI
jgi:hypothetical protein